jgi:alkylated DNA repair dioxygenase AlkB
MALDWQPSLLGDGVAAFDAGLASVARTDLGSGAWLDVVEGWVSGADELFARVLDEAPWAAHERKMFDRMIVEPRLTTREWVDPTPPIPAIADALSAHYGFDLHAVSANLYRDGRDSVAWHGDRIGRKVPETVVAILALGSTRRFLLRPASGGPSRRYETRSGDLLVLGGTCQRTWQHAVPKCREAGPRISVMFREGY